MKLLIKNMKLLTKNTILILIVLNIFIISACENGNNNVNNPIVTDTTQNFFFNEEISYWKMKNNKGDTAYFQATEKETISIAMKFWDTTEYNRINVIATPIQFVYWEDGMKKRQHFAIVSHNNKLFFATKRHQLVANYTLNHYIFLFTISNEPENDYIETDSVSYPLINQTWELNYATKWQIIKDVDTTSDSLDSNFNQIEKYNIIYTAFNNMLTPKTYIEEFGFIKNIGFFSYMGYKLVSTKE